MELHVSGPASIFMRISNQHPVPFVHRRLPLITALLALCLVRAWAQDGAGTGTPGGRPIADTLALSGDTLQLSHEFIQTGTLSVDGLSPDGQAGAIRFDARSGRIILRAGVVDSLRQAGVAKLIIRYRALPFRLPLQFRNRELAAMPDSVNIDSMRYSVPATPLSMESIFGPELQKSGYIGRGFTVGSNRDLALNSGFRLQMSGRLSDDIAVVAALTDENTPIQPEGNTRTLQELDKVFVRIDAPHVSATLGDFVLTHTTTEFGRYNRKLSGILGEGTFDGGTLSASYATMKGAFHTNSFNGLDAVQGPYRLTGRNGEQRIVVIAGTEKVFVDGVEMVRGESNDYVIEYGSGEITFKPRRIITANSRIVVDFEYADREYMRSMFTANGTARLFGDRMDVTARYIREADDQDSPIDIQLSDEDRRILEQAGGDARNTWRSGAVYVGLDSTRTRGAGLYALIDTLIGGASIGIYRHQPGTDSATYAVQFSYVGAGQGDYIRKTLGTYEFVGIGVGDHAPVRILPLPRVQQNAVLMLDARPGGGLTVSGEAAVSSLNRNRFALGDSATSTGEALRLRTDWQSSGAGPGAVSLHASLRSIAPDFTAADRINEVEFSRTWGLQDATAARETILEVGAGYRPTSFLASDVAVGSMRRGGFSSLRINGGLSASESPALPWLTSASYAVEHIASDNPDGNQRGTWLRQRGDAQAGFGILRPRIRLEQERRTDENSAGDSLRATSLAFIDLRPGVELVDIAGMRFSADVGFRREDAMFDGRLVRQSDDMLQQYGWSMRSGQEFTTSASLTIRDRHFTEPFRLAGNQDVQSIMSRVQSQASTFNRAVAADLLYEVSTERTARLERVFWKVPVGQGSYIYTGDSNGNGLQDENEFEPTRFDGDYVLITVPSQALFPVIDLKTGIRLTLTPSRIPPSGSGFMSDLLRALSAETQIRVEEKSRDPRTSNIYLLRTSTFMSDSNTIRGFQTFRQDLFLFDQQPDFSLRLRFDQRRSATQYALASERAYRREQSLRMRSQLVREIGLQTDLAFITDNVGSTQTSNRARAIEAVTFAGDLSYRPWPRVEMGMVLTLKSARDGYQGAGLDASINSEAVRAAVTFDGPGRLRIELERNEVILSETVVQFPYELTDGRPQGQSWVWRVNLDYRLAGFIQSTLSYLGRSESGVVIHTARAEVKAYF